MPRVLTVTISIPDNTRATGSALLEAFGELVKQTSEIADEECQTIYVVDPDYSDTNVSCECKWEITKETSNASM